MTDAVKTLDLARYAEQLLTPIFSASAGLRSVAVIFDVPDAIFDPAIPRHLVLRSTGRDLTAEDVAVVENLLTSSIGLTNNLLSVYQRMMIDNASTPRRLLENYQRQQAELEAKIEKLQHSRDALLTEVRSLTEEVRQLRGLTTGEQVSQPEDSRTFADTHSH